MPIDTYSSLSLDNGSGQIGKLPNLEGAGVVVTTIPFPDQLHLNESPNGEAEAADALMESDTPVRRIRRTREQQREILQRFGEAQKEDEKLGDGKNTNAKFVLKQYGVSKAQVYLYRCRLQEVVVAQHQQAAVSPQPTPTEVALDANTPTDPPDVPSITARNGTPQAASAPTPAPIGDIYPSGNPNAPVDAMGSARPQVMDRKVDNVETQEHRFIRWAQTLTRRYTTESSEELVRDLFDTYHERIRHALRDHRAVSDTKSTANAQIDEAFVLALRKFKVPRPGEDVVHFFVVRTERFLGRSRARPTHGTPSQVPSPVHKEDPKEMMEQIMAAALQTGFRTFEDEYAVQWRANATAYMSRDVSVKKLRKEILGTEARTSNLAVQALLNHMKGIMREVVAQKAFLFENGGYVLRGIVARMAWCIYSYEGSAEGLEEAVRAALTLCVEEKEKKLAAPQH